ncbi:hypothetical protein T09_10136 [Trichinella sp. T9]|nr:hypothetical protein T09_10136 [Trichinella sp. T9]
MKPIDCNVKSPFSSLSKVRLTGRMKNGKIVPKPPTSTSLLQFSFESGLLVASSNVLNANPRAVLDILMDTF